MADSGGFEPVNLPAHLFDYQTNLVEWAVRKGHGGIFADCGLGKTPMALAWADQIHRHTGKPVLFLTPLAVGFQVATEAEKFGHDAALSRNGQVSAPITITNYEQLEKFDWREFGGVVCDESSAIKAFDGSRRAEVTEFMRRIQFRLLGTATAAPNDYIELGTSSEALGYLATWTCSQGSSSTTTARCQAVAAIWAAKRWSGDLKGHAEKPFWRWVSSWARAIRRPSDYGYSDDRHHPPELIVRETKVEAHRPAKGTLFDVPAHGLREEREENRRTLVERCEAAAAALEHAETAVAWCHLNDESALLAN